jgi:hypothetical protein
MNGGIRSTAECNEAETGSSHERVVGEPLSHVISLLLNILVVVEKFKR